jgi:hypothetical protein
VRPFGPENKARGKNADQAEAGDGGTRPPRAKETRTLNFHIHDEIDDTTGDEPAPRRSDLSL